MDVSLERVRKLLAAGDRDAVIAAVETLMRELTTTEVLLQQKVREVERLREAVASLQRGGKRVNGEQMTVR